MGRLLRAPTSASAAVGLTAGIAVVALVLGGLLALSPGIGLLLLASCILILTSAWAAAQADDWGLRSDAPHYSAPASEADRAMSLSRFLYFAGIVLVGAQLVRPYAGLTASDLLFLAAVLTTVATAGTFNSSTGALPAPLLIAVALFGVGALASSFASQDPAESVAFLARFLYLTIVWFWLGTVLLTKKSHIVVAVVCWVIAAAITSGGAVAQFFLGNVIPGGQVDYGRYTGLTGHVNDLAGVVGIAFLPALLLVSLWRTFSWKTVCAYLLFAALSVGLLLSGSVGGLSAAAVGILIWLVLVRARWRSALVLLTLVFAASFTQGRLSQNDPTVSSSPLQRLHTVTNSSEGSRATALLREDTLLVAFRRIEAQPVLGVGLDRASAKTETGYLVHNIIVKAWYEAGLLGLTGMLLLLLTVGVSGWRAMKHARDASEKRIGAALLSGFIAFLVFGSGAPLLFQRYGWMPAALILALRAQQLRPAASAAPPAHTRGPLNSAAGLTVQRSAPTRC